MLYRSNAGPIALHRQDGTDSDTRTRGVPNLLSSLAVPPDGGWIAVSGQVDNDERGLWYGTEALTFETTLRAILRGIDASTWTNLEPFDRQLDDQGHAGPLAFSPLGDRLFVAHPGTGMVQVLDGYDGGAFLTLLDAGVGLDGIVVDPSGDRLYTLASIRPGDPGVRPAERRGGAAAGGVARGRGR
jgi:DNA-binding beta-propeller fold protein YncE